ncbi:MAG: glycosyltransferase family 2 protein [Bacteroidota bacterium]|nr:glycosyltransferase family 2 protein [Bacteroidota bacterium]MDP3144990.1 glycosyltransferase family 2 protein [Bacteroidota bacterium]MDP3556022.1 glycosyltransferase family 2 protein [Bacteroidota bacterium]
MPKISIITPCYYNGDNIPVTFPVLLENEKNFPEGTQIEYVFVDDGSKDNTFEQLKIVQAKYPSKVKVIKLSRNFGANNASFAGICNATGDCCVILSADLQDPPELIPQLYSHWLKGYKLVLAQKTNREDSFITKFFSNTYHNLVRKIILKNSPKGGFDLWLFDKTLRDEIMNMNERNFHLPTLFMWLGFEYVSIPYTRRKREIGKSGWTFSKKLKTFIDSFVAFTYLPLRMISVVGITLGLLSIIYALSILLNRFISGVEVAGWSSLMIVLLFTSSFIMISLGIIGEYLYRTLDAARNRPNFVIDQKLDETSGSKN